MPLLFAPIGKELKIHKICSDIKTRRHLENLGFISGQSITALYSCGGNMIIKIKDGRLALNREIASKILVN